jgi:hypothetical protein
MKFNKLKPTDESGEIANDADNKKLVARYPLGHYFLLLHFYCQLFGTQLISLCIRRQPRVVMESQWFWLDIMAMQPV